MTTRIGLVVAALLILSGCTEQTVDEARMECLSEASNAPTDLGVRQRVMLCHQKYPKVTYTKINPVESGNQAKVAAVDWSQFTPTGEVVVQDAQYGFSVSRPSEWFPQERPSPDVRFMFGLEGDGYVGNCNIVVLPSPSTASASQEAVDRNENQRQLSASFFEAALRNVGTDAKVLNVRQTRRGPYFGHLVDYVYRSFSSQLNSELHFRAELFSHSRPGRVYSFTCLTGATSSDAAQSGFEKELKSFESLSANLRVDVLSD